jgi:hypothetical protein
LRAEIEGGRVASLSVHQGAPTRCGLSDRTRDVI